MDSMLLCICAVMDHRRHQNAVRTKKNINIFCYLLLNRHGIHLFYKETNKNSVNEVIFTSILYIDHI